MLKNAAGDIMKQFEKKFYYDINLASSKGF